MTDWLLVNEASFIEYPADPNARTPIKVSGVRVLANEAKKKEEEHYFIYPKIFLMKLLRDSLKKYGAQHTFFHQVY